MHQSIAYESTIEPSHPQILINSSCTVSYILFPIMHHWSAFLVALELPDNSVEGVNHNMRKYAGNNETIHRRFLHKGKPAIGKKHIF